MPKILPQKETAKYGKIGICGELFTADDCGEDRLVQIHGVTGQAVFNAGLKIILEEDPSYGLRTNMQRLGFTTGKSCLGLEDKDCQEWQTTDYLDRQSIKRLKTYAREIKYCDSLK